MKRGEEVSGKEGPIVERIRSKGEIRRQGGVKASNRAFEVRSSSSCRKNLVELLSSSRFVLVSEGRGIHSSLLRYIGSFYTYW